MDEIKTKQQVVEQIKQAEKILITVSDNPSVDALSAALGLTLLLDAQEKYVTAIYSGETPPAIAFLQPEKTFDDTTDSLRDFIIALNKEKADHLRYKVEGDSVKIFITPYKTVITDKDLEFSQGDYNVELVIALGVDNQAHLDHALETHGQILHDADIITVTAGDQTSDLGGLDWHDVQASSLSEMVSGLAEALKDDKKKSLLDASIATALLTGIVAETDRFSNEHTTSKAMTVAATLMAAGADQQLIATELQRAHTINLEPTGDADDSDANDGSDGENTAETAPDESAKVVKKKDGLSIVHDGETLADLDKRVRGEKKAEEKVAEEIDALEESAEALAKKYPLVETPAAPVELPAAPLGAPAAAYAAPDLTAEAEGATSSTDEPVAAVVPPEASVAATAGPVIVSHSYMDDSPELSGNTNPAEVLSHDAASFPGQPEVAPGSVAVNEAPLTQSISSAYAFDEPAALAQPAQSPTPADLGLPLPPPLPDFSAVGVPNPLSGMQTPPAPAIPLPPTQQPEILGDILAPEPTAPAPAQPSVPPASEPQNPGQFQIPPQQ